MTLKEILDLIRDEEARIEVEYYKYYTKEDEYMYFSFWLSDYRQIGDRITSYLDNKVISVSFDDQNEKQSQILIHIEV